MKIVNAEKYESDSVSLRETSGNKRCDNCVFLYTVLDNILKCKIVKGGGNIGFTCSEWMPREPKMPKVYEE